MEIKQRDESIGIAIGVGTALTAVGVILAMALTKKK
jgi:hypothetical protein